MQDNISPEERLLRLIRGEHKKNAPKKQHPAQEINDSKGEDILPQNKPLERNIFAVEKHFSFNQPNRIILLILLLLAVYLIADFMIISPLAFKGKISGLKDSKDQAWQVPSKDALSFQSVSYYSQAVKSRNLFTAAAETENRKPSLTFMEMVSTLKLQGIISGTNPQAIIEDTRTKQVYFLYPGDCIGEIKLQEILPGKVKLGFYGQEAELSL